MVQYIQQTEGGDGMRRAYGSGRNTALLAVFLLLLVLTAALAVFAEPLYEMQRAAVVSQALAILEGGTTAVDVDAGAYPVHGEEDASPSLTDDAARFGGETAVYEEPLADGRVALQLYGTLAIPCIDLKLPLYRSAGNTALRFGGGVAAAGGTTVVFGRRTRVDGRLFHDIDRLANGDGATLTRVDRVRTAYTVAAIRLLQPDALAAELAAPPDGANVAIVSCHPAGQTDGRIVVWLKPV